MRKNLILTLVAALAVTLTACGGSNSSKAGAPSGKPLSKSQYLAKIGQIETNLQKVIPSASGSGGMDKKAATEAKTELLAFADELGKVNPPVAVKTAHTDMISALRQFADEMPAMFEKANKASSPSDAIAAIFGAKSFQALLKAQQEFQAAGYELPSSTGETTTTTK
ncbi:MAG: hypothetical protein ACXVZW_11480 [Gaiellaceae bacterium]